MRHALAALFILACLSSGGCIRLFQDDPGNDEVRQVHAMATATMSTSQSPAALRSASAVSTTSTAKSR